MAESRQKTVRVRFLKDHDPNLTLTGGVITCGTELDLEDYGEVNGQRMLRYFPEGSSLDARIPNDIVEIIGD